MQRYCARPGCERGFDKGDILYRVSPKGTKFIGVCKEHYDTPAVKAVSETTKDSSNENRRNI